MKQYLIIFLIILLAGVLRLINLSTNPAGLNADEASLGYNAYSLLETGRDEHNTSWPLSFRSFDDYKPPLYVYIVLPFIKLLGLNVFAVRLPSALLGIGTVVLTYLLANQIFPQKKLNLGLNFNLLPGDIAAFILAVSPWHLHFSRGAWEVNIATFFLLLGLYAFIKALEAPKWFFVAGLSLVASLYSYHSMRVVAPLLALAGVAFYFPDFRNSLKASQRHLLSAIALSAIISLPLVFQTFAGSTSSRFSGVSVFADQGPLWQALDLRSKHPSDSLIAKTLHNRYLSYSMRFTQNYLSHFSPRFLFIVGDEIARSKVPGIGQSYLFLAPFALIGLLILFKELNKGAKLILVWLILSPIPAALTFQSPHALRAQNMIVPLSIIMALGVYQLFKSYKPRILFLSLLLLVSFYNLGSYLRQYYVYYPKELPYAWQYGFEQLADYLEPKVSKYDQIIVSDRYDQPYILIAFFLKYPPQKLQQELVFSDRDNFGFSTGRSFGNFKFHRIDWNKDSQNKNSLIVVADESVPDNANLVHTINYPNNLPAFRIYETQ